MRRFSLLAIFLFSLPVQAVIIRLTSLDEIFKDSTFIIEATVETLDPDRPSAMLKPIQALKGKPAFKKLPILIKGDAGARERKEVPQLLDRLVVKLPVVLFITQRGKKHLAFAYTNGTWFALTAQTVEGEVRWVFDHLEPYLYRTYKGTTTEMLDLVRDVLAGKKKAPPPDAKGKPGLGPKATKASLHREEPFRRGVIVAPFVAGPLAILAMLFPAVFAGWTRWLVLASAVCTAFTVVGLYWLTSVRFAGNWLASPPAAWLLLTLLHLAALAWAWSRHQQRVATADAPLLPSWVEVGILGGFGLVGAAALAIAHYRFHVALITPDLWLVTAYVAGLCFAFLGAAWARLRGPRLMPAMSCEACVLAGVMAASLAIGPALMQGRVGGGAVRDEVWTFRLPRGGRIDTSPLVADGRVYVGATMGAIGAYGTIYCLDQETGEVLWHFDADGEMKPAYSSPVIAEGVLYFGEGLHDNSHCKLYALDPRTGEKLGEYGTLSHTEATPVVVGDSVYVGAGDHGLHKVNRAGLKKAWTFEQFHIDSGPAVLGDSLYVGSCLGDVYKDTLVFRLDAATGKPITKGSWPVRTELPVMARVVASNGQVFAGLGVGRVTERPDRPAGRLLCLDAETGREQWNRKFPAGVFTRPAVDRQRVYVGSNDGVFHALARQDGWSAWSRRIGDGIAAGAVLDRPAGSEEPPERIYVASLDGRIAALYPGTGEPLWTRDMFDGSTAVEVIGTPALDVSRSEGKVIRRLFVPVTLKAAGGDVGELRCYEDRTGAD